MKNTKPAINAKQKIQKKWKILGIAGFVILIILGWWAYVNFMPHPLGDKLEYVGKSDHGCPLICDANPGSTYYYATDMTPEDVVGYFKGAEVLNALDERNWKDMGDSFWINFKNKQSGTEFSAIYYVNSEDAAHTLHRSSLNKAHAIKINQEWYDPAHSSL